MPLGLDIKIVPHSTTDHPSPLDYLDYIPFVSTIVNLQHIIHNALACQRTCCQIPSVESKSNHIYHYLERTHFPRHALLLIPIIGNILIAIFDIKKYSNKEYIRSLCQHKHSMLKKAEKWVRQDKEFIISLINEEPGILCDVEQFLKADKEVVKVAIQKCGFMLWCVSESLKDDKEIALMAINNYGWALESVSERLKNDPEVVFAALQKTLSSPRPPFVPISKSGVLEYAGEQIRADKTFMLKVIEIVPDALNYLSSSLKNDSEVFKTAIKNRFSSYEAYKLAGEKLKKASSFWRQQGDLTSQMLIEKAESKRKESNRA